MQKHEKLRKGKSMTEVRDNSNTLQKMQICSSCFRNKAEHGKRIGLEVTPNENLVSTFYCCGRVPPEGFYRKRHGMCEIEKSDSSVELVVEALEDSNLGLTKIPNPDVPYVDDLPEELFQGRAIEVFGKLTDNASRFSINLATGNNNNSDLALHFNPRLDRHIIIRNHRIRKKWGVEEITSLQDFPFTRGRNFSVLIFVADEQFLIAVNKVHYCAFAFRIPVSKIKSVIILGDISLTLVQHSDKNVYPPIIFKKKPYIIVPHSAKKKKFKYHFRRKVKAIKVGSQVEIFGRLKLLPRAFYVNFQKGITLWPHPIIPFHLSYRLHLPGTHKSEREIIFNSWLDGLWGKEEIIGLVPFLPGAEFHLKIICKPNAYDVYVNDEFLYSYTKRSEIEVDSVVIHGDVVIHKVVLH